MSERFVVAGDGEYRGIRYVVIDRTTDNVVGRYTDPARADARAAQLNRRHRDHDGHVGFIAGQPCPHPIGYQKGVSCALCNDTGIIQQPAA